MGYGIFRQNYWFPTTVLPGIINDHSHSFRMVMFTMINLRDIKTSKNVFSKYTNIIYSFYIPSLIIASLLLLKLIVNSTYMRQCTFP